MLGIVHLAVCPVVFELILFKLALFVIFGRVLDRLYVAGDLLRRTECRTGKTPRRSGDHAGHAALLLSGSPRGIAAEDTGDEAVGLYHGPRSAEDHHKTRGIV